jgi:hypothetical protein
MNATELLNTDAFKSLLVRCGDDDAEVAYAAQKEFAKAITEPLRQGVLVGDILDGVFERTNLERGATPRYVLDLIAPGEEGQHVAYTIPKTGYLPQRVVEGDYVQIPTYRVGNAIDWPLFLARDARYDVAARAMEAFYAGFVKKLNDDGMHTLLAAAVDRNIVVYDADASAGQFTKRFVSLLKVTMVRNGGGNTGSLRRSKLTHVWTSHEAIEDIRNWNVDQIDEITRRDFFTTDSISSMFGVALIPLDEFGEDSEYQSYYTNQLSGTMGSSDVEVVLGLDLSKNDSFVMPIREQLSVFADPTLHRQQRAGWYGWTEIGFAVLDGRRTLLGSF